MRPFSGGTRYVGTSQHVDIIIWHNLVVIRLALISAAKPFDLMMMDVRRDEKSKIQVNQAI